MQNQSSLPMFSVLLYPIFQYNPTNGAAIGVISRCQEKFPKILRYCYQSSNFPTVSDILKHHLTAAMQVLTSVFHLNWQEHLHRLGGYHIRSTGRWTHRTADSNIQSTRSPFVSVLSIASALTKFPRQIILTEFIENLFVCLLAKTDPGDRD
jgi:hypothetical protein